MNETLWLAALGVAVSAVGALVLVLLGIIIYEIRQLRADLKECVPDAMCRVMMSAHEDRLHALEEKGKR